MIRCTTKKTALDGKPVLLDFGLDVFANLDVELELKVLIKLSMKDYKRSLLLQLKQAIH